MRILAYAYSASLHCIACTQHAADCGLLTREPPLKLGTDENGIAFDLVDSDDNPIRSVFHHEDIQEEYCDDCQVPL